MSEVKFNPDLFTGSQELNRLQSIMKSNFDFILQYQTKKFGIFRSYLNQSTDYNNFLIEPNVPSANDGKLKIGQPSYAIDSLNRILYTDILTDIVVPNDNKWYWLKIGYTTTSLEVGTISVSQNGSIVGLNTKFLDVLRGLPDFPVSIKLFQKSGAASVNNPQEYQVVSVIDNNNAVISGNLVSEQNLKYKVVGCFTPGVQIPEADKFIYSYDSCLLTFVIEEPQDTNTAPVKSNNEFWIARVKNDSGTITIQDKRTEYYTYRWE